MAEIMVVKIGGTDGVNISNICYELADLHNKGQKIVVVHGGSKDANQLGEDLGSPPQFITSPSGFTSRYTDQKTLEIFSMALKGKVNVKIVSAFQKLGVNAFGMSGLDGGIIQAERKKKVVSIVNGKRKIIRDDFSGKITKVNAKTIHWMLEQELLPVIAPLAVSEEGDPVNVDADRVAAEIAASLKAEQLFLFTAVKGIMRSFPDINTWIPNLTIHQLDDAIGYVEGRMKKKVLSAKEAITNGVEQVWIGDGRVENPIQYALSGQATRIGG